MITYNINRILKARGIDKPFAYLKSVGFSDNFSTRVKNNRVRVLRLRELEKLCVVLHCTPNDLMEWTPDPKSPTSADHPLETIRKTNKIIELTQTLNRIPLNKLEDIEQLIEDQLT